MRFTQKGGAVYAILMDKPTGTITVKSFGSGAGLLDKPIAKVQLLGSREKLNWKQTKEGLVVQAPTHLPSEIGCALKVTF